ncbi:MAG: pyridoxal-phosphate-dependent aminotransferase family protein [Fusobacteriaceae bacterium]
MYKPDYLLMTAGPTMVRKNVMDARAKFFGNPDLDEDFFIFYENMCEKMKKILKAEKSTVIFMSGEGMVGLDAACASLTEPGDEVLVIGNGIFGDGFSDLIKPYGGNITEFKGDWKTPLNADELEIFIKNSEKKFKYATIVHCDTPSGMLNDVEKICKVLKSNGILTVVDSVAAMGGTPLEVDEWGIDIVLGASQKVFSAPPGLTILTVSKNAWNSIKKRKTSVASYYCNLLLWENAIEKRYFPYSMPASDLMGLDVAMDNILDYGIEKLCEEHKKIAAYTRKTLNEIGLENYLKEGYSPTVTAFLVPEGYNSENIIKHMKERYSVLIAGSYGKLKGKVLRIGHMGENIFNNRIEYTLKALKNTLEDLKIE